MTKSDQELRDWLATEWMMSPAPVHNCMSDEPLRGHFKDGFDSRQAQVDELRAEVAEWRNRFQAEQADHRRIRDEYDQLREEVERLNGLLARDTNVSPWPEKIRLEFTENQYTDEIRRLKAMAERLVEALERIAQDDNLVDEPRHYKELIAEEALAEWDKFKEGKK